MATVPPQRVTIRDVARAAAVSTATVSKVLNDQPRVSPETRRLVHETMARLGYRPSAVARGLRSQRSRILAMITDDIEGLFTAAMMRGVEEVASLEDYSVMLCNSYGDPDKERRHLQRLSDQRVEAVVLMSGHRVKPRGAPALALPGVPIVYLYQYDMTGQAPSVLPDDKGGAALAIEHLLSLGRKRIAFINGPARFEATHDRRDGVLSALARAGVPADRQRFLEADDWYPEHGFHLTNQLLAAAEPPDAIFCASDDLAGGSLAALREAGIKVPTDIALVGFDDRPAAAHLHPPLTTIKLPLTEMGRRAGRLLLDAVAGAPPPPSIDRLPCELIIRASSDPSASSNWSTVQERQMPA